MPVRIRNGISGPTLQCGVCERKPSSSKLSGLERSQHCTELIRYCNTLSSFHLCHSFAASSRLNHSSNMKSVVSNETSPKSLQYLDVKLAKAAALFP